MCHGEKVPMKHMAINNPIPITYINATKIITKIITKIHNLWKTKESYNNSLGGNKKNFFLNHFQKCFASEIHYTLLL